MYFLGLFMTGEVATVDKTAVADIDFFPWPFFGNTYDAEKALDAPIDIVMISAKSRTWRQTSSTPRRTASSGPQARLR